MPVIEATPLLISMIGTAGTIVVGYLAYRGNKKTEKRVDDVPTTLVQEFAKLNPGVDTVEKVIELLYTEIERLKQDGQKKDERIDKLVSEKAELLDEVRALKYSVNDYKRKLEFLEARITKSIGDDSNSV